MKTEIPNPVIPRQLAEIEAEFQALCAQLGHAQYNVELYKSNAQQLVGQISKVNQEALERKNLDDAAAKAEAPALAVANVASN